MRFPTAVKRLHCDDIGKLQPLADLDGLLMELNRLGVVAIAPSHGSQVIQRIGHMPLVVHRARRRERLVQARGRLLICIGPSIGHAELDQEIAHAFALATIARHVDHALEVSNCTRGLARLRARCTALFDQCELRLLVHRISVRLGESHGPIKPTQGLAHREPSLRLLGRLHQIMDGLRPHLSPLVMLGESSGAFVRFGTLALLERLGNRAMEQHPPSAADVEVHDLAHLVVAEIVDAAFDFLAQELAFDQWFDRVQQRGLRLLSYRLQQLEVEAPAQHSGDLERRPNLARYAIDARTHRRTQCFRQGVLTARRRAKVHAR